MGVYALGLHLVIGPVGAVRLAHGLEQVLAGDAGGGAGHDRGAAAAGGAGVRGELRVAQFELYHLRGEARLTQGLVAGGQRRDVGALAVVLPGVAQRHRAVRVEVRPALGGVGVVKAAAVDAEGDADAVFHLAVGGGVLLRDALFRGLVVRAREVEEVLLAVDVRTAAVGRPGVVGLLVAVHGAELEGVDAQLRGHDVHGDVAAHEALRRAVGAEGAAPGVVREHRRALVADGRDVEARADELAQTVGQQVAELGVRAVVDVVVAPEGQHLAVVIRRELDVHEARAALAGVGDGLVHVEVQRDRPLADQSRDAEDGLVGGRELVAEGAAGVVLHQAQLIHRDADAVGYHGHVQVDAYALGVDGQHAVLVYVGIAVVGFEVEVRLPGAVALDLDHVGRGVEVEVRALDAVRLIVGVRRAGVDLDGVGGQSLGHAHVGGQDFKVHLHGLGGLAGVRLGVRSDYRDGVAVLEDLFIAEDGTVPAVALVVERQHDEAVYAVLAGDVLRGDDLEDAGHLLGLGGVHALDVGVGDLGLDERQTQGAFRHVQGLVRAEVPGAGDLHGRGGPRVGGAGDDVLGGLEEQVLLAHLAAHDGGRGHRRVDEGLVARAAAEVAVLVEPVADLLAGRVRVLLEQDLRADDEARAAEAALGAAVGHPRDLDGVQVVHRAYALDGGYLCIVAELHDLGDAGARDLSVYDDVACAAMAFAAADFAAREHQPLAQDLGKRFGALQH